MDLKPEKMVENDVWLPVAQEGEWEADNGITYNFNNEFLTKIVEATKGRTYDGNKFGFTPGHPTGSGSPAIAWAKNHSVKYEDGVLSVMPYEVLPQFKQMHNSKMYGRFSIGLNEDFSLDHIAALGVSEPAIMNLPFVELKAKGTFIGFNEDDKGINFNYSKKEKIEFAHGSLPLDLTKFKFEDIAEAVGNVREFLISKFSVELADQFMPKTLIKKIGEETASTVYVPENIVASEFTKQITKNTNTGDNKMGETKKVDKKVETIEFTAEDKKVLQDKLDAANLKIKQDEDEKKANFAKTEKQSTVDFMSKKEVLARMSKQSLDLLKGILQYCEKDSNKIEFSNGDSSINKRLKDRIQEFALSLPLMVDTGETGDGESKTKEDLVFKRAKDAANRYNKAKGIKVAD